MNDIPLDTLVPSESKFLAKEDVGEQGINVTIKGFKQGVEVGTGQDADYKTIMGFEEDIKPMVLNKTNLNLLRHYFPDAKTSADLKGKRINVWSDPSVDFGGKLVGGLRVRAEQQAQAPASPAADMVDDGSIPF